MINRCLPHPTQGEVHKKGEKNAYWRNTTSLATLLMKTLLDISNFALIAKITEALLAKKCGGVGTSPKLLIFNK